MGSAWGYGVAVWFPPSPSWGRPYGAAAHCGVRSCRDRFSADPVGPPLFLIGSHRALCLLLWGLRSVMGSPLCLLWGLRSVMGSPLCYGVSALFVVGSPLCYGVSALLWGLRSVVGSPLCLLWGLCSVMGSPLCLLWGLRSVLGSPLCCGVSALFVVGSPLCYGVSALLWGFQGGSVYRSPFPCWAQCPQRHVGKRRRCRGGHSAPPPQTPPGCRAAKWGMGDGRDPMGRAQRGASLCPTYPNGALRAAQRPLPPPAPQLLPQTDLHCPPTAPQLTSTAPPLLPTAPPLPPN